MKGVKQGFTAVVFLVMVLSMADTFVAATFDSSYVFKVVVGGQKIISGKLVGTVRPIEGETTGPFQSNRIENPVLLKKVLSYVPHHESFRIRFIELKGRLWRAELLTDVGARPGEYPVHVFQTGNPPDPKEPPYRIQLFADEAAYQRSLVSFFRKWVGVDPWWVGIALIPVALGIFFHAWKKSGKEEAELQRRGIGAIYKLAKKKDGWELMFGLGSDHGIRAGDRLYVLDRRGRPTGQEVTAEGVSKEAAEARMDSKADIRPEYLIARQVDQKEKMPV
jgi:hypothetical protein